MFGVGYSDPQRQFSPDPACADQRIMHATLERIAEVAALLIGFGMPWLKEDEVNLGPPYLGFGSARFWLPGTVAFGAHTLFEMCFDGM